MKLPATALRHLRDTPVLSCCELLNQIREARTLPWAELSTAPFVPAPDEFPLPVLTSDLREQKYNLGYSDKLSIYLFR